MRDQFGREVKYLRLSVTDLCNYRCLYCMGAEGVRKRLHAEILSVEEMTEIVRAAALCGVCKVRLTGGEPLVRRGIVELCRQIHDIPGIQELAVTTNGSILNQYAQALKAAGVTRLNVSIDSLQAGTFKKISRRGELSEAMSGLQAAKEAGFTGIKLNTVLLGGINDGEIGELVELTKDEPYCLRFIELMPIGECAHWPSARFIGAETVLATVPELRRLGVQGVAEIYGVPGYRGTVGLIRPLSHSFCAECDRIRVTADGMLKPCLNSDVEIPLKGLQGEALLEAMREGIRQKPRRHFLSRTRCSDTERSMNEIGG